MSKKQELKLPLALKLAINNYYAFQRSGWLNYQFPDKYEYKPPEDWKEQAMKYVNKICKLHGIGFVRIAGTFFFNKNEKRIEVSNPCTI